MKDDFYIGDPGDEQDNSEELAIESFEGFAIG